MVFEVDRKVPSVSFFDYVGSALCGEIVLLSQRDF